jgi:hypothetical protein
MKDTLATLFSLLILVALMWLGMEAAGKAIDGGGYVEKVSIRF